MCGPLKVLYLLISLLLNYWRVSVLYLGMAMIGSGSWCFDWYCRRVKQERGYLREHFRQWMVKRKWREEFWQSSFVILQLRRKNAAYTKRIQRRFFLFSFFHSPSILFVYGVHNNAVIASFFDSFVSYFVY